MSINYFIRVIIWLFICGIVLFVCFVVPVIKKINKKYVKIVHENRKKNKDNKEKYRKYLKKCDQKGKVSLSYKQWKFVYGKN